MTCEKKLVLTFLPILNIIFNCIAKDSAIDAAIEACPKLHVVEIIYHKKDVKHRDRMRELRRIFFGSQSEFKDQETYLSQPPRIGPIEDSPNEIFQYTISPYTGWTTYAMIFNKKNLIITHLDGINTLSKTRQALDNEEVQEFIKNIFASCIPLTQEQRAALNRYL